jgi:hypothetical protein
MIGQWMENLLRLKDAPQDGAAAWLERPQLMLADTTYVRVKLRGAFDAVIFVQQVRAADQIPDRAELQQPNP